MKIALALFLASSVSSAGPHTFRGQIFKRESGYYIIREYAAIQPAYKLEFDKRVDTRTICLANIAHGCPYYEIELMSTRQLGSVTEFRGVRILNASLERPKK
jgi:hypothetical protein